MALSNDRNTPYKDTEVLAVQVAGGIKIFAGALVAANAAGFAVPGAVATTLTYLGRAEERVDNAAGVDGAAVVRVRRNKAFKWANGVADPISQADLGKPCYILDDQTVVKTSGANTRSAAGKVMGVDVDGVWVE